MLKKQFKSMYETAQVLEASNKPGGVTKKLGRGLILFVRIFRGKFQLAIGRRGVYPSAAEWDTCVKNLPDGIATAQTPDPEFYAPNPGDINWLRYEFRIRG